MAALSTIVSCDDGCGPTHHDDTFTAAGIQGCCFRIFRNQVARLTDSAQLTAGAFGVAVDRAQDCDAVYEPDWPSVGNSTVEL